MTYVRTYFSRDMDYSYFGDDDSSGPGAFSDADTALGISNYVSIDSEFITFNIHTNYLSRVIRSSTHAECR